MSSDTDSKKSAMESLEFGHLLQSLNTGLVGEKDQYIRIKAAANSYYFTCDQIEKMINLTKFHQVDVLTCLYPRCLDQENFDKKCLGALKWEEDREAVRDKIKS